MSLGLLSTSFCFRLSERCLPLQWYRFGSFVFLSVIDIISAVRRDSTTIDSLFSCVPKSKFQWCSEMDFQIFTRKKLFTFNFFFFPQTLLMFANLEANSTCWYSRAIDILRNLWQRYQELTRSVAEEELLISRFRTSPHVLLLCTY